VPLYIRDMWLQTRSSYIYELAGNRMVSRYRSLVILKNLERQKNKEIPYKEGLVEDNGSRMGYTFLWEVGARVRRGDVRRGNVQGACELMPGDITVSCDGVTLRHACIACPMRVCGYPMLTGGRGERMGCNRVCSVAIECPW
jgi:hypothetical protein